MYGQPAFSSGFASGAQLAELWFTSGANSILAISSIKRSWFAYGTTHRQSGGFAFGAQSMELWFTSGANSNLATFSPKWGWFAYSTTHRQSGGFAYGTELWFTYGAISSTTTTLVSPPAQ